MGKPCGANSLPKQRWFRLCWIALLPSVESIAPREIRRTSRGRLMWCHGEPQIRDRHCGALGSARADAKTSANLGMVKLPVMSGNLSNNCKVRSLVPQINCGYPEFRVANGRSSCWWCHDPHCWVLGRPPSRHEIIKQVSLGLVSTRSLRTRFIDTHIHIHIWMQIHICIHIHIYIDKQM